MLLFAKNILIKLIGEQLFVPLLAAAAAVADCDDVWANALALAKVSWFLGVLMIVW